MTEETASRKWAKLSEVRAGDTIHAFGLGCVTDGATREVKSRKDAEGEDELYIVCDHGTHGLAGIAVMNTPEEGDTLVGITRQ